MQWLDGSPENGIGATGVFDFIAAIHLKLPDDTVGDEDGGARDLRFVAKDGHRDGLHALHDSGTTGPKMIAGAGTEGADRDGEEKA